MQITAFSSVQALSRVRFFATPWTAARQASLSITNSQSPPKVMSIESVIPSSCLILCRPLLLLPSVFPSIRDFSSESALITALGAQISNEQTLPTRCCIQVEKRSLFEIFGREDTYYQSSWRHRICSPVNLNLETWRHPVQGGSGNGPMDGHGGWRARFPACASKSHRRVGTEPASSKHVLHTGSS